MRADQNDRDRSILDVRHTLTMQNKTNAASDDHGRTLKLEWTGDTEDEPVLNVIDPGEECFRHSKRVVIGDHAKNFVIRVLRVKDGDDEEIGTFTHSIDNGGDGEAISDTTWIGVQYESSGAQVKRGYSIATDGGPQDIVDFIGDPMPFDVW